MNRIIHFLVLNLIVLTAFASGESGLPAVKLIHAEASIFYHEVYISWSTEYEESAGDFYVEGSNDGLDWRIRGKVHSSGNPGEIREYNLVDGKNETFKYYRIRRLGNDGKVSILSQFEPDNYSINVVLEEIEIDNEKKLLIEYNIDKDQEVMVRIFNHIGEQVVTKVMPFNEAGEYVYQMDISDLKKGSYLMVVTQVMLDKAVAEKSFVVKK